jgi:hypothetical protein
LFRASLAAFLLLAPLAPCGADPAPVVHYAPAENLERVDVGLIDRAEHEIDLAEELIYVVCDWVHHSRNNWVVCGELLREAIARFPEP